MVNNETTPTVLDVEGFSVHDPVENEDDWLDCVRWPVNYHWQDRKYHDRDGYLCELAGSTECLALGHTPDPADGWWADPDLHPLGWDGYEPICPATRYASACTQCESEDCGGWEPFDPSALWRAVSG